MATTNAQNLCVVCQAKPGYFDGQKTHPCCSKTCASKTCDYCHQKPKYTDGKTTHPFCGRTCAQQAAKSGGGTKPTGTAGGAGTPSLKGGCLLCGKATKGPFCGKTCSSKADSNAPQLIEIPNTHDIFKSVADQFKTSWRQGGTSPAVRRVYKVIGLPSSIAQYEAYKASVEARGHFAASGRSPGNENRRWHGTRRDCLLGDNGNTTFCNSTTCALCNIIRSSYKLNLAAAGLFGRGIYTSSTSSKSNGYSRNVQSSPQKAMILNKVVVGKGYKLTSTNSSLTAAPQGYDSVLGELGNDELICYTDNAVRPSYLLTYDSP